MTWNEYSQLAYLLRHGLLPRGPRPVPRKSRRLMTRIIGVAIFGLIGYAQAASTINSLPAVTFPLPDPGAAASSTRNIWVSNGNGANADFRATYTQLGYMLQSAIPPVSPFAMQFWWDTSTVAYPKLRPYGGNAWGNAGAMDTATGIWTPPVGGGTATAAGAGTVDLGALPQAAVTISGNATIASFGSSAVAGTVRFLTFSGASTLTYNATSMILPTAASIVTAANDTAIAQYLGSGNWRVMNYSRASGAPVVSIANNAALKLLPGYVGAAVTREGFATAGDGGQATYVYSPSACTLVSGAGDDGTQVTEVNGGCWNVSAKRPYDIRMWGLTSGPINLYVDLAGLDGPDDANYCVRSANPCRTARHATDIAYALNAAGGSVKMNLAAGAYSESIAANYPLPGSGNGAFNPNGTNSQPGQLLISGAGSSTTTLTGNGLCGTIIASNYAVIGVRAIKLKGDAGSCMSSLFIQLGATINGYDDIDFGDATIDHIHLENPGSSFQAWYSYTVSGNATRHIAAGQGASYIHSAFPTGVITFTVPPPTFSDAFIHATQASTVQFNSNVSWAGTFVGTRYIVEENAIISTYPSTSLTWIPGTVAGVGYAGGIYAGPTPGQFTGAVRQGGDGTITQASCIDLLFIDCNNVAWTPAIAFGGASVGVTYGTQLGFYSRFNKVVFVQFDVILTSKGSSTGAAGVLNLPFAGKTSVIQPCVIGHYDNMSLVSAGFSGTFINSATATVEIAGPGASTTVAYDNTNFTNTSRISGFCTYMTD